MIVKQENYSIGYSVRRRMKILKIIYHICTANMNNYNLWSDKYRNSYRSIESIDLTRIDSKQ